MSNVELPRLKRLGFTGFSFAKNDKILYPNIYYESLIQGL